MAIAASFPSIKPSLSLDFANVGALDPRVTFTRSTTGTYYDGVTTAKAEENLFLQSQDYSTTWIATNLTPVTGKTAPDSTSTATEFTANIGTFQVQLHQALTLATATAFSIFVKAGTHPYVQLRYTGDATSFVNFDVTAGAGAVGTSGGTATGSIVDVGNGWYRCIAVNTSTAVTGYYVNLVPSSSSARAASLTALGTETVELWGAQVEKRDAVTAYTPTTTQPITNYIPVLQTAAAGQARFDHNPTTGEALGLLIEEQRTNLVLRSEDFGNATWTKSNATIDGNSVIAPDGMLTADLLIDTSANIEHYTQQSFSCTSGTVYTFSGYVKQKPGSYTTGVIRTWLTGSVVHTIDFVAGTITGGGTLTSVGNGWYRFAITRTASATGTAYIESYTKQASAYAGTGFDGHCVWGFQVEAGAFPTSYIPTTSASVTRTADAASMTGANFSSWYVVNQGTMYFESQKSPETSNGRYIQVTNSGASSRFDIFQDGTNATTFATVGNAPQAQYSISTVGLNNLKVAFALAVNDFATSVNGSPVSTDISCLVPTDVSGLFIGKYNSVNNAFMLNGCIRKLAYYPARLTNAELQALTA